LGSARSGTPHFIFHTAFCCSTLLLRACAQVRGTIGLNEPKILNDLASRILAEGAFATRARLDLVLSLLGRNPVSGGSVIVKPTNFANPLIDPILRLRPEARAVLLYSDLRTMLYSVARRGALGRAWGRQMYDAYARFSSLDFGFSAAETFHQTDLQIAGLGWLMEVSHLMEIASGHGERRAILIQADDLLADPRMHLAKVYRVFGLEHQPDTIEGVLNGPIFSTHSKDTRVRYDRQIRERERSSILATHADEIRMVSEWIETIARHIGLRLEALDPAFA
jgi:hypothetical protein